MSWAGAITDHHAIGAANYFLVRSGTGPPVLLLHGFPETHLCWADVAPRLADRHTVVAPDLRGYGASTAPAGGPAGEGYTKREMAHELVGLMSALGHERFAVVGHDRGARVAYRMALDHPQRVSRLAVLNIIPTVDQFARMGTGPSLGYWPWFLLAQPAPFPERLLASDPSALLDHVFATWTGDGDAIGPERRAAYRAAMTPATIAAMCADYRASFHLDRWHDSKDLITGRQITAQLLLAIGGNEQQLSDAPAVWQRWAPTLAVSRLPGGHFLPEEAPQALTAVLSDFLEAPSA